MVSTIWAVFILEGVEEQLHYLTYDENHAKAKATELNKAGRMAQYVQLEIETEL